MLLSLTELTGFRVSSGNGDWGEVYDFYFDSTSWRVSRVMVRTAQGLVLLRTGAIRRVDPKRRRLLAEHEGTGPADGSPPAGLLSLRQVCEFTVGAIDGDCGRASDLQVEADTWKIHNLMVTVADPVRRPLLAVAPLWVRMVSAPARRVKLVISRAGAAVSAAAVKEAHA